MAKKSTGSAKSVQRSTSNIKSSSANSGSKSTGSTKNLYRNSDGSSASKTTTNTSKTTSSTGRRTPTQRVVRIDQKRIGREARTNSGGSRSYNTASASSAERKNNSSIKTLYSDYTEKNTSARKYGRHGTSDDYKDKRRDYRNARDEKDKEDEVDVGQLIWGLGDQAATQVVGDALGAVDLFIGTPLQKALDIAEEKLGIEDRGENFISAYNKQFQEKARKEAEEYAKNASKGEIASFINEYGPDVLALLPDIALAYMSGGTTLAAKTASVAGKAAKFDNAADLLKAAKAAAKNGSLWSGAVRTSGQSYNQALAEGAEESDAIKYALANGALDLGLNGLGFMRGQAGMETLPDALRKSGDAVQNAANYGKAILHDGLEGVGQGMAQRGSRAIYDENVKLVSGDDPNAVLNPKAAAMDFAMGGSGAALASGLHAGTKALDAPANAAADRLERAYFKDHIMRGDEKLDKKSAIEQAEILRKLTHGQLLGNEEIKKLNMNNKEIQNLFTRETGVPLSIHDLDIKHEDVLRQKLNFAATKVKNADAITDTNKYPLAKFSDQIYNNIATNPRSHKYKHGDWAGREIKTENEVFNGKPLAANTSYVCGENNYIYQTDGSGRIQNATGVLLLKNKEKNKNRERMPSNQTPGKLKGDDAGHIFADMFGGSPKLLNLVSENAHVNVSDHKKVENLLNRALKSGEKVYVDYEIHYPKDGVRPDSFTVTYYHGAEDSYGKMEPFSVVIENPEPTPKKSQKSRR